MAHEQIVTDEPNVVEEPVTRRAASRPAEGINQVLRVVGLVAAAVPTVIGLIAAAKIDWSSNGFDSAPVVVADMRFTPWIAVGTVAAGVIAMLAAASVDRVSKLLVGAILACAGLAVMLATPVVDDITVVFRYGVMFFVVGLVLAATGALMRARRVLV